MRLGHMSDASVMMLNGRGLLKGQMKEKLDLCEHCIIRKQH